MVFTVGSQRQGIKPTLAAFAGGDSDEDAAAPEGRAAGAGRGTGGAHRRLGVAAAQAGDLQAALDAFSQALLHAGDEDAQLHEMRAQVRRGRWLRALLPAGRRRSKQCATQQAALARADWWNVHAPPTAQVLLALGRDFEAVQAAERACHLDPAFAAAWLTRARANRNLGEPHIAVDCLERLAGLEPGHDALRTELPEARVLASRRAAVGGVRMQVLGNGVAGSGSGGGGGAQDTMEGARA
jgi:tetratricopeptide (TPR) repeat protein